MNFVEEGMMEIMVKAAQYRVRVKEIVLPKGQYLAFAHACKAHEVDAKPRAFFDGSAKVVPVHDSFKLAAPSGYITIRCEPDAPARVAQSCGVFIPDFHDRRFGFHRAMIDVAADIVEERQRQVKKFGVQKHPDGTGGPGTREAANECREACDVAKKTGSLSWRRILDEEVAEAYAETDPKNLRAELVQVAAVAAAWIEDIDSRKK